MKPINSLEEGTNPLFDYSKLDGLIPVVAQDASTRQILMSAYADRNAVERTIQTGFATFWSRRRKKLWTKGEESGNKLLVKEILTDCDQDGLVYIVDMENGGACHTKYEDDTPRTSCFYRKVEGNLDSLTFLDRTRLDRKSSGIGDTIEREYSQIDERYRNPKDGSETTKTFKRKDGVERKLMEEAWEVTSASVGNETKERKISELADLEYRKLQYMVQYGITLEMLSAEMKKRQK